MTQDIRWHQRFSNYRKALQKLNQAIAVIQHPPETRSAEEREAVETILKEGLIQRFEYTHELAWNVMKDYAEFQGPSTLRGARDATRSAFEMGLIDQGERWMEMIQSRNLTSHTYNEGTADEIYDQIVQVYHPLFISFEQKMENLRSGKQPGIFDKAI